MQSQKLLNEYYVSLAENNIHFGMATVVCVGFNKWALPGGQIIESQHKARKSAEKLNSAMGGRQ